MCACVFPCVWVGGDIATDATLDLAGTFKSLHGTYVVPPEDLACRHHCNVRFLFFLSISDPPLSVADDRACPEGPHGIITVV